MLKLRHYITIILLMLPFSASSAVLVEVGGELLGINNLVVQGNSYDVSFVDGSCISVFGGCDANSDFDFQDNTGATAATIAIHSALQGTVYDDEPYRIFGCGTTGDGACEILVPWLLDSGGYIAGRIYNDDQEINDQIGNRFLDNPATDWTTAPFFVFAKFEASTSVPAPLNMLMLAGGLVLLRLRKA